ncbi:MAG: O-antigen ligase family protein [Ruminococcus sp.]|nr:O-antigen ligase family protein [Ruminococcus sp.]MCM1381342.1 O-antigen ligase family protein [Muribaculaceae bacterium]MCM1479224.1 O-antigen ligase family protein [Muribaculaceae bacterium]
MPKTIFGTTEKSNFILNMKYETVRKWITVLLCGAVLIPFVGAAVMTFSEKTNWAFGAFLYAAGFSCLLFYVALLMRKDVAFKDNPAVFPVIALAVLAFASYYRVVFAGGSSDSVNTAMLGEQGRYEGLLSIFAYLGIFLLAASAMRYGTVQRVMDVLVGAGIIGAAVAVMQHIPWGFPSKFRMLPALLLLKNVHLSSGLSENPIIYGSFLTVVFGVALTGALYSENVVRARVYGCGAALFFMTGLFTSSLVPLIGMGAVLLFTAVTEFAANKGGVRFETGLLKSSRKRLAAAVLSFAVIFGAVFALQGIYLRDKSIAFTDSYNNLFITYGAAMGNDDSLWKIGAERSFRLIKDHPLLGVGPDRMAMYQQAREELLINGVDKSYNEYLYIAATRGIPSLAAYLALLVMTAVRLFKGVREFSADRSKWFKAAVFVTVLAYWVQAFFSASAVTSAPYFWLIMGFAWAKFSDEKR